VTIATTFQPPFSVRGGGLQTLPRLTERERASVVTAMDAGELVPVINSQPTSGAEIVAVVAPDHLERFCTEPDDWTRTTIDNRLAELSNELDSLREIVREVMAEKQPADFRYRILDSLSDAVDLLKLAQDAAESL
jgi:hypothetical protein